MPSYNRREFLTAVGMAGLASTAGCITSDTEGSDKNTGTDKSSGDKSGGSGGNQLTWDAGGTGGTYYPLSNQFKDIVQSNTKYSLQVRSTGASVENVGSLASGKADFALIQNDVAYFAHKGTGIKEFEGNSVPDLRGVATLYPETIQVIAQGGSNISSITDLQGATINTGDLGSGTQVDAKQILKAVGINDYNEQNASFSQAAEQIQNGDIDAAFIVGGWPVGAIEDLATNTNITIVPIEGNARKKVLNSGSYFAEDKIPGGTYSGIQNPVPTVAVQAMIATVKQTPKQAVQDVTAAIFDNLDKVSNKQEFISVDSAQDGMSIPLHPGAKAYFGKTGTSSGNNSLN
ncbi:TAXI family TRAP transporter solute-binding subunit [Halocatena marina]|uniref:TAXI family TRAP transporter solute-binding subunit n=1 Tax=Halocatena marina TaxID=2934937 RepID=UPI00200F1B57|nr:TAXI family TRAP transporter solute-binding subunit [Halocatena marina]